jgi:hypothetical protein
LHHPFSFLLSFSIAAATGKAAGKQEQLPATRYSNNIETENSLSLNGKIYAKTVYLFNESAKV